MSSHPSSQPPTFRNNTPMKNLSDILNPDLRVPGTETKWGYRLMAETEYHSFPAVSSSLLKCATLAEMYAMFTQPGKQTDALALGTLADMAILTPEEPWSERFAVANIPINPTTGKAYGADSKKATEVVSATKAANPGKFVASVDFIRDMTTELDQIVRAFNNNALCRASLDNSLRQVCGIMWHPKWQCWVKWKPDVLPLAPDPKLGWSLGDLKTTRRHILDFEKDCFEFGYFNQAGWYQHCHETHMQARGLPFKMTFFDFLVVSKADDNARYPRPAMARKIRVPLDPELNLHMGSFHRRIFPTDGMGKVEQFLAAVAEHTALMPDPADPVAINRIWGAFENESEPYLLCREPRN